MENFEFKRRKTQTTLGWHQTIERNNTHSEWQTGQANKYHTKSWGQAKWNTTKDGSIW